MIPKPGEPLPDGYVWASDNLPARDQGSWARDKLKFLDYYKDPALGATKKKHGQAYYIDLFAGPGVNVGRREGGSRPDEYEGSPIRALRAEYEDKEGETHRFRGYYFCNLEELDHHALSQRVRAELDRQAGSLQADQVHCLLGDANELIDRILEQIPTFAYVLVFADVEGPRDLRFATLRKLKHAHKSVDLYVLYPDNVGLYRLMDYEKQGRKKYVALLDAYFGTEEWQRIVEAQTTPSQSPEMQRRLLDLYLSQLETVWKHSLVQRRVRKSGPKEGRPLYKTLFAYDHAAAGSIARSERSRSIDQLGLFNGFLDAP